ncbi:MAG TPA: hypothetical protein VK821_11585 [Dehalococcoidia bacterium]|nr:hypothetical protein [Dehalococcoidia bacterium]
MPSTPNQTDQWSTDDEWSGGLTAAEVEAEVCPKRRILKGRWSGTPPTLGVVVVIVTAWDLVFSPWLAAPAPGHPPRAPQWCVRHVMRVPISFISWT